MTELPHYFEYQLALPPDKQNLDLYPFVYEAETMTFKIADETIPVTDFDPYKFIPDLDLGNAAKPINISESREYHALLPDMTGVIGGPKLHNFTLQNPDVFESARRVMHDALIAVIDGGSDIPFDEDEHGFMGYAAHNMGSEDSPQGIRFQVFGNCACMGVHQDGLYIQGMEHGFVQYDLHNADLPAQRVGLYAGLGHLAKLASEA
jgi:hypothetical protein